MTVGNSHGGHPFEPSDGRKWRTVKSANYATFYRAVAHTICLLSSSSSLLLQPADDGRMAELVARPEPAFRVWRRSNLIHARAPKHILEMIEQLELSVMRYWRVTNPRQLTYAGGLWTRSASIDS
jgi:hypothetical protein